MGWMSATVSTAIPFFSSNALISSFSARMHTTQYQEQINLHPRTSQEIDNIGKKKIYVAGIIRLKMELALDNHIRLGDGGESAVEWVYFSRGQEALKFIFTRTHF